MSRVRLTARDLLPLVGFVAPTVAIGYGVVIPGSCIAGVNEFDSWVASGGNGTHFAFVADTREAVDAFHAAALAGGATDEGPPGPRAYPHREVYAAFVRDPWGNKLESLTDGFAA